jgi:hypothetical protein
VHNHFRVYIVYLSFLELDDTRVLSEGDITQKVRDVKAIDEEQN